MGPKSDLHAQAARCHFKGGSQFRRPSRTIGQSARSASRRFRGGRQFSRAGKLRPGVAALFRQRRHPAPGPTRQALPTSSSHRPWLSSRRAKRALSSKARIRFLSCASSNAGPPAASRRTKSPPRSIRKSGSSKRSRCSTSYLNGRQSSRPTFRIASRTQPRVRTGLMLPLLPRGLMISIPTCRLGSAEWSIDWICPKKLPIKTPREAAVSRRLFSLGYGPTRFRR